MKKFIYNALLFTIIACIGYVVLLWIFGSMGWVRTATTKMGGTDHLCTRVREIPQYHNVDILFLGSSHSYRTFDTRFYRAHGYNCFNLGSSNQTPIQTRVLLEAYLDSLHPKQVVMEVHPDILNQDGIESAVDLLTNVPLTKEMTHMAWKTGNMKAINTWLYAIFSQKLSRRFDSFVEDSIINHAAYVPGGFVEVDTVVFERKRYPKRPITIRPEQMEALKSCIEMFKDRNIPYMLVQVQDAEQLRSSFTNEDWFAQQMSALGPFHYEVLPMDDTVHFYNSNHLSQSGIEMFNEYFIKILSHDQTLAN